MSVRHVAVLGATGSIGQATLEVLAGLSPRFRIWGLSGHRQLQSLRAAVESCRPRVVVLSDPECASAASQESPGEAAFWGEGVRVQEGPEALVRLAAAPEVDIVVAAIVGRAGVESTLAAVAAGKRVALANKETLVVAGPLVHQQLSESTAQLLPVDSEHSAIFQCLAASGVAAPDDAAARIGRATHLARDVRRLVITASGGPFRTWSPQRMREATVEQALEHPTWKMGAKITIDSATMMNKALEVIEARWLFGVTADQMEVVVHPQSVIHSMVEFVDGSVVAQMSPPDMRLPIQYALTYPERLPCPAPMLDRSRNWELNLEPADPERFPALPLGFEVARVGGTAGAVVNAANEQAVDLFLNGSIRFTDIVPACRAALDHHTHEERTSLRRLIELDRWARAEVRRWSCGTRA